MTWVITFHGFLSVMSSVAFPLGGPMPFPRINWMDQSMEIMLTSLNTTTLFMNVSVSSKTSELDIGATKSSG